MILVGCISQNYRRRRETAICVLAFLLLPGFSAWGQSRSIRGLSGDLWADKILGHADYGIPGSSFGMIQFNETTAKTTFNPSGVFVDQHNDTLYLWDDGNNRILVVHNVSRAQSGQGADMVLGQPDFHHTACNGDSNWQSYNWRGGSMPVLPSASCLCGLIYDAQSPAETESAASMASDSQGNLYVPDYFNNRVLRYDYPVESGQAASYLWGQSTAGGAPDFTGETYNNIGGNVSGGPTSTNLFLFAHGVLDDATAGVAIDPWGNLWVTDVENNRVLRFPNPNAPNPGVPARGADVVLGQNDFNSNTPASSPADKTHLYEPRAVRVDAGGHVYVTEANQTYDRMTVYSPSTPPSGGNPPLYAASGSVPVTQFALPGWGNGIEFDPTVSYPSVVLWVDYHQNGALEYQFRWTPTLSASRIQDLSYPVYGAIGVASDGDLYFVNGSTGSDGTVYRFKKSGSAYTQDINVFALPAAVNGEPDPNMIGDVSFNYCVGVMVAGWGGVTQIIGNDGPRIHFWNMPSGGPANLTNGVPEDGYAGTNQPYVDEKDTFSQMAQDQSGHLWVIHGGTRIERYDLPLPSANPETTPTDVFTGPLSVLGKALPVTIQHAYGLAMDNWGNLWYSDQVYSRVMRIHDPLRLAGGPYIDVVLGQVDPGSGPIGDYCNGTGAPTGGACANTSPTAKTLNWPGHIVVDHQPNGGDLFVADHSLEDEGNLRVLRFDAKSLPPNPASCVFDLPADGVYGTGGSFTAYRPCVDGNPCPPTGEDDIAYAWGMAFNSDDTILVAGTNGQISGRPPVILQSPLNGIMPAGTPDIPGAGDNPIGHLEDFGPQSMSLKFDGQDNLYVGENNRSRILVYLHPFTALGPTPTPQTENCCQGTALPTPIMGMNSPYGMAVNYSTGYLYVTDTGNKLLRVYNASTGAQVASFGSWTASGSPQAFSGPNDVAYDKNGNIYVADYNRGEVDVFNGSTYAYLTAVGTGAVGSPRGVMVDNQGTTTSVYITSQNSNVYRFDSTTGAFPASPAAVFGGTSVLNVANEIVKYGNAVVTEDDGGNIVSFSLPGYTPTVLNPGLGSLKSLRLDLAGNIYIANPAGLYEFLSGLSGTPHYCGLPNSPWGVAVDGTGRIFVDEQGAGSVTVLQACVSEPTLTPSFTPLPTVGPGTPTYTATFTPSNSPTSSPTPTPSPTGTPTVSPTITFTPLPTGTPLPCALASSWTVSEPYGIAYGASGVGTQVYVADDSTNLIDVFSATGAAQGTMGTGILAVPVGVAVDGSGNVYVTDQAQSIYTQGQAQYRVDVFSSGGSLLHQWGATASSTGNTGLLEAPVGIAVNAAGTTVYLADQNTEQVEAFNGSGTPLFQFGGPSNFIYPTGVALDASGNVYVADWGSGEVQVFSPLGSPLAQWDATQNTALLTANSVAVYANCRVYVSDGFGTVAVFDLNGNPLGNIQQAGGSAFDDAQGIALAGDQSLYVADYGQGQVYQVAPCPAVVCTTSTVSPTSTATLTETSPGTFTPSSTRTPTLTPTNTSTASPSGTPTDTALPTSTPTFTPTPDPSTVVLGPPYPNPVKGDGPLYIPLQVPTGSTVTLDVFTTAFRMVAWSSQTLSGNSVLSWDLRDQWGMGVASGLYYLRVRVVSEGIPTTQILKVIVLR